jgi:Domain of unknown function (DUF222)
MSVPPSRITAMRFAAPREPGECLVALDRAVGVIASASAQALGAVAEVERAGLWRRDGATSITSWLAGRYGLSWGTAREWVRVAHALEGLPVIAEAYRAGRLSWDQLRPLTRFADSATDARWAEEAPERRPAALWREARRHERCLAREAEEARRQRFLRLDWDHERSVLWLEGMLPAEEGTAFRAALLQKAADVPSDPEAADPREPGWPMRWWKWPRASPNRPPWWCTRGPRSWPGRSPNSGRGSRKPKPVSVSRQRPSGGWPATAGSSGSWSRGDGRWGSAGGAGRSPASSSGCSGTGTERRAGTPGASGSGGSTPTTWSTGGTVGPRTSTTWCSCARSTTG